MPDFHASASGPILKLIVVEGLVSVLNIATKIRLLGRTGGIFKVAHCFNAMSLAICAIEYVVLTFMLDLNLAAAHDFAGVLFRHLIFFNDVVELALLAVSADLFGADTPRPARQP